MQFNWWRCGLLQMLIPQHSAAQHSTAADQPQRTRVAQRGRLAQQVPQQLLPQRSVLVVQLAPLLARSRRRHGRRAGVQKPVCG